MTREEFFANVQAFKRGEVLQHSDEDAYYNALAIATKMRLAELCGMTDDAAKFEHDLAAVLKEHNFKDEVLQAAETEAQERYKSISMSHAAKFNTDSIKQDRVAVWKQKYMNRAIADLKAHPEWLAGKFTDDLAYWSNQPAYFDELNEITTRDQYSSIIKAIISKSGLRRLQNNERFAQHSDDILEHGTKWKDHKYIRIENGRYIYEDQETRDKRKERIEDLDTRGHQIMPTQTISRNEDKNRLDAIDAAADASDKGYKRTLAELKKQDKMPVLSEEDTKEGLRKANESASKAQSEGEAQQKWKDEQKAKAAAAEVRKGDNSAKQAEDAMKGYEQDKKNKENWNNIANGKDSPLNKSEAEKAYDRTLKDMQTIQDKVYAEPMTKDQFIVWGTKEFPYWSRENLEDMYASLYSSNKDLRDAVSLYDKIWKEIDGGKTYEDAVEEATQNTDENLVKSVLKMISPSASKEYIDEMYMNTRKNKFSHSFSQPEDFYAAVQAYKSKSVFQ